MVLAAFAMWRLNLYNAGLFWFRPKRHARPVVAVAQLVESRIVIPVVVGSSPISHPTSFKQKAHLVEVGFLFDGTTNPHRV